MPVRRLARPFTAAVTVAFALGLSGAPYAAADTTVVVHGPGQLPSDGSWGIFLSSCVVPGESAQQGDTPGPIHIEQGPAPIPAGTRTWGFDSQLSGFAVGPVESETSMSSLSTATGSFYSDSGTAQGIGVAGVEEDATHFWFGNTPLSIMAGSWQTPSVAGSSYSWNEYDGSNAIVGTFTGTISAMLNHIGTGDHAGLIGIGFGCNTPGLVHFDKAQFGAAGAVTTYDFEAELTKTTITSKPSTITAGQSETLKGVMTDATGAAFSSADLTLQAKAYGASSWSTVGQTTESYDFNTQTQTPAKLKKKPLVQTKYRWVYAGGQAAEGSTSPSVTVKVHTAVTAKAKDSSVKKGGTITITGRTTPAKPGHTVELMKGGTKIGSGIVRSDGSYAIKAKATSTGTWKLHVTIGAFSGNLAGASRTVKVTVG